MATIGSMQRRFGNGGRPHPSVEVIDKRRIDRRCSSHRHGTDIFTPVRFELELNYHVEQEDAFGPQSLLGFNITPVIHNFIDDAFRKKERRLTASMSGARA